MAQKDVKLPGDQLSAKMTTLDMGAAATQNFDPLKNFCSETLTFHWYNGDMNRQICTIHICSSINEEVKQCLIYDKNESDAKLVGLLYLISANLFKTLPEEEKKYWHDHVYEIKGGLMVAPRLPTIAEHEQMTKLIDKYAKVIHFWQVDRGDPIPLGPPQLMMSFTEDGQLRPDMIELRNKLSTSSMDDSRKNRQDIPVNFIIDPAANHWKTGKAYQFTAGQVDMKLATFPTTF